MNASRERFSTKMASHFTATLFADGGDIDGDHLPTAPSSMQGTGAWMGFSPVPVTFAVSESAADADLKKIHADWMSNAKKYLSEAEVAARDVRVENGKLYCRELILERGAEVVVTTQPAKDDFYGTITTINAHDVFVQLSDGSKSRVLVKHLQNGRASVRRDL